MLSMSNKKTKIILFTIIGVLVSSILILSGIGIGLKIAMKNKKPNTEVNPLSFSIDTWDGSVNALDFNENYAGRGSLTKTINSAASFVHFVNSVNNGNDYKDYTIYLNNSIDLKGQTIDSIGKGNACFRGTFDGGYYTIYNAKINGNGLFGNTENATIKNIGLYNADTNLVDKAVNTNIENTFVRFGEGNLVNEYISNNGTHYIKNSFVHSSAVGLINKLNTNNSSENEVTISNCYFTNGETAINENVDTVFTSQEKLIKATHKSDFINWSYSEEYSSDKAWCDYDYLKGSKKLDFTYPLQTGFVKVYLTGSCYESVVVAGDKIVDATNLAQAFDEADKETEAEVNLLVEKIFMEARAEVENSTVTVNAVEDTTIIRGEHNEDAMFVSTSNGKIVIGSDQQTRTSETKKIVLDGNKDFVEENNLNSGSMILAINGNVEIHNNVELRNNTNNTTNYGGAVMLYNTESQAKINAKIENCYAENGGAIAVVGKSPASYGTIENCSAVRGGAVYMTDELPSEDVAAINTRYGIKLNIKPTETYTEQQTSSTIDSDDTFTGCSATQGGAVYCTNVMGFTISGSPIFENNYTTAGAGGAIYSSAQVTISGNPEFNVNSALDGHGGAIYCASDVIIYGSAIFDANYAIQTQGGAIYAVGAVRIYDNSDTTEVEQTKIINNWICYGDQNGGAIASEMQIDIGGNTYISGNYAIWPDSSTYAGAMIAPTISIYGTAYVDVYADGYSSMDKDPNGTYEYLSGSNCGGLVAQTLAIDGSATLSSGGFYATDINIYGTPTIGTDLYIAYDWIYTNRNGTITINSEFNRTGGTIYLGSYSYSAYIILNTSITSNLYPVYKYDAAAYTRSNAESYICNYSSSSYVSNATTLRPFFVTNMPSGCILDYSTKSDYGVIVEGTSEDTIDIAQTEVSAIPGDSISISVVSIGGFSVDSVETNSIVSYTGGTSLSSGFQTLTFKALAEGTDTITIVLDDGTTHSFDITFNIAYPTDQLYVVDKSIILCANIVLSTGYVHIPDQYLDGSIVLSSSDNNVVSTTTSSNIAISSDMFDVVNYLSVVGTSGSATISVSLYSFSGILVNTGTIRISVVTPSSWCTPGYIEVTIGGDIDVYVDYGFTDSSLYLTTSDSSVVSLINSSVNPEGDDLSDDLEAVGVGTAIIYLDGPDYSNYVDDQPGSVSGFFIVKVYDPATSLTLSVSSYSVCIDDEIDITASVPEACGTGYVKISTSDSSIIEVTNSEMLSVQSIGETFNLNDFLSMKQIGKATISVKLYSDADESTWYDTRSVEISVLESLFTINQTSITACAGEDVYATLTPTSMPDGATYLLGYITSSDSNVVSVDSPEYVYNSHFEIYDTTTDINFGQYLNPVGEGEATITIQVKSYKEGTGVTSGVLTTKRLSVKVFAPTLEVLAGWEDGHTNSAIDDKLYVNVKALKDNVYVFIREDGSDEYFTVAEPTIAEIGGSKRHFKLNTGEMENLSRYITTNYGGSTVYLDVYCADDGTSYTESFSVNLHCDDTIKLSKTKVITDLDGTIDLTATALQDSYYVDITSSNPNAVKVKTGNEYDSWTGIDGSYYIYHAALSSTGDSFNVGDYLEIVGTGSAVITLGTRHMSSDPGPATGFEIIVLDELFAELSEARVVTAVGETVWTEIKSLKNSNYFSLTSSDENVVKVNDPTIELEGSGSYHFKLDENETISLEDYVTVVGEGVATISIYILWYEEIVEQTLVLDIVGKERVYPLVEDKEIFIGDTVELSLTTQTSVTTYHLTINDETIVGVSSNSGTFNGDPVVLTGLKEGVARAVISYDLPEDMTGETYETSFLINVLDPTKKFELETNECSVFLGDDVNVSATLPTYYPNATIKVTSDYESVEVLTTEHILVSGLSADFLKDILATRSLGTATINIALYENGTGSTLLKTEQLIVCVEEMPVAQIYNGTSWDYYYSLEDAISAAVDNDVIVVMKDYYLTNYLTIDKNLTITAINNATIYIHETLIAKSSEEATSIISVGESNTLTLGYNGNEYQGLALSRIYFDGQYITETNNKGTISVLIKSYNINIYNNVQMQNISANTNLLNVSDTCNMYGGTISNIQSNGSFMIVGEGLFTGGLQINNCSTNGFLVYSMFKLTLDGVTFNNDTANNNLIHAFGEITIKDVSFIDNEANWLMSLYIQNGKKIEIDSVTSSGNSTTKDYEVSFGSLDSGTIEIKDGFKINKIHLLNGEEEKNLNLKFTENLASDQSFIITANDYSAYDYLTQSAFIVFASGVTADLSKFTAPRGYDFEISIISDETRVYLDPIQAMVVFDANGGTFAEGESDSMGITYGEAYGTLPVVTREGHTFLGWFTKSDGGTEIKAETLFQEIDHQTLYAHWSVHKYTITWVDEDDTVLETDENVEYGSTPSYDGTTPSKQSTAQYTYTFAGWVPEVVDVVGNATYKATYTSVVNKYTITWVDEDGTELEVDENVEYGATPTFDKGTPEKSATAQYTYTFSGWTPTVVNVVGDETYQATYTSAVNKYTITWVDEDGTELEVDENVEYGATPSYDGTQPSKVATAQYTYTFAGWTPAVVEVGGDATYKATYTSTVNKYTITWIDDDGTELEIDENVEYGATPTFDKGTPEKPATAQYTYAFSGWAPAVVEVVGDATYQATYTSAVNKYTITWVDENDQVLETDSVEYGEMPIFDGIVPEKTATAQYTYTFSGWTPTVVNVAGDETYKVTYSSVVNKYTITWVDEDGTVLETDENVEYGATPSYDGTQPSKTATAQYTYIFDGWTPAVVEVIGDETYKANYSSVVNKYTITWVDDDGTELEVDENVEYGATPTFDKGTPEKPATAQYTYTFSGWAPSVVEVVGDTTYQATYSSVANEYTLTYDLNYENSGEYPSQTWKFGETISLPEQPTRTNYSFGGWYFDKEFKQELTNSSTMPAEDITVYAQWLQNAFTLTMNLNYEGSTAQSKEVGAGETVVISDPVREGYNFAGWYTDSECKTAFSLVMPNNALTIYASWQAKTMTVTFNANGGTTNTTEKTVTFDKTYGVLPEATREGYTFIGWFTEASAGTHIEATTKVTASEDHTLYAQWQAKTCTVAFNANGGEVDETERGVTYDEMYGALPISTREGYTFIGWYTETSAGTKVEATTKVTASENHTLYAQWQAKTMTVTFNGNGGIVSTTEKAVTYDSVYGELPTPTRTGYEFVGWFTEASAGTKVEATTQVTATEDHTLYAHWSKNAFVLTINLNYENAEIKEQTFETGQIVNIEDPTREGYNFVGWYTDAECKTAFSLVMPNNALTIYASWQAKTMTVTFNANGGTTNTTEKTVTFDKTYGVLPEATREGYTFIGWFTEASAGTIVEPTTKVTASEDHTLYAQWQAKTCKVTFNANGGEVEETERGVTYDEMYGALPIPSRVGYTFTGWFTEASSGTKVEATTKITASEDHTLYAQWQAKTMKVTFNGNGGIVSTTEKTVTYDSVYGELPTPTKTGCEFVGWFTETSSGTKVEESSTVKTSVDHTLYAQWQAKTMTVTFNANGGTASTTEMTVTYGDSYGELPTPNKPGYIFAGWYTELAGGTKIEDSTIVNVETEHMLYAHWVAVSIKVTFNGNGGTTIETERTVEFDETYGALPEATREGYTFIGWYTEASAGTKVESTTYVTASEDHTLYAQWQAKTCTVAFNANGGIVDVYVKTVTFDSVYGALPMPTRKGYGFIGWFTLPNDGEKIEATTKVSIDEYHTLYAQWQARTFKVTFDANGGRVNTTEITVNYDGNYGELPTPTRTGYNFVGWFTEAGEDICVTETTLVQVTEDHTLYAHWQAKTMTVTFNANGGTISTTEKTVTYDSAYGELPTPTKTGYTCVGWFTEISGGSQVSKDTVVKTESNHYLYAIWEINKYQITSTITGNGTINPAGIIVKNYGEKQRFRFIPNEGHHVAAIILDDVALTGEELVEAVQNGILFENISSEHSIYVEFEIDTFTVNISCGENGTINPIGQYIYNYGEVVNISITPNVGYSIQSILVNGNNLNVDYEEIVKNGYKIDRVTRDYTIYVEFFENVYKINVSSEGNGTVKLSATNQTLFPNATIESKYSDNKQFSFHAEEDSYISSIIVDGTPLTGSDLEYAIVNGYAFNNIVSNHTLKVIFEIKQYKINVSITEGVGRVIFDDNLSYVNHGENRVLIIDTNYDRYRVEIYINGNRTYPVDKQVVLENVKGDMIIEVKFVKKSFLETKLGIIVVISSCVFVIGLVTATLVITRIRRNRRTRLIK